MEMEDIDTISRYYKIVFGYVFSLCGNRELTEDIVQDTFVKAILHEKCFRGDCKMESPVKLHVRQRLHHLCTYRDCHQIQRYHSQQPACLALPDCKKYILLLSEKEKRAGTGRTRMCGT